MDKPEISIILPTLNESGNISHMIDRLEAAVAGVIEIIVVDDGSYDGTIKEAEHKKTQYGNVVLEVRRSPDGLTGAIQKGIDIAKGDIIVWMDADMSMPPENLPLLINKVKNDGFDVAVGSRFVEGGMDLAGDVRSLVIRLHRKTTRIFNCLAKCLSGVDFGDWTSGFIAIRRDVIKGTRLRGYYGEYFIYLVGALVKSGAKVVEIPYTCGPRTAGYSKTTATASFFLKNSIRYTLALLRVRKMGSRKCAEGLH